MTSLPPSVTLEDLADRHDVFFVDQFGVLLDGTQPYPGAVQALMSLKARGKTVIILSNSGRSGAYNGQRLARLGLGPDLYDHVVTSGDAAYALISGGAADLPSAQGTPCFTISSGRDFNLAERLRFKIVDRAAEAELVVISGSEADRVGLDAYREMLRPAAARNVPAVCTNPDIEMLTGRGKAPGAGAIAQAYEEMGGSVRWIGKPHADIYAYAHGLCGTPDKAEIIAIGDSIEHDIAGAAQFGIAAALVRTGIHAGLDGEALARLLEAGGGLRPFILPAFRPLGWAHADM